MHNLLLILLSLLSLFKPSVAINTQPLPHLSNEPYQCVRKMNKTVHLSRSYDKDLINGKEYIFRYVHGRLWWYYISDEDCDLRGVGINTILNNRLVDPDEFNEAWKYSEEVDRDLPYPIWSNGDINQAGFVTHSSFHPERNNPFNIVYTKQTKKFMGMLRQDKYGFCVFSDRNYGIRAGLILLLGYINLGYTSIDKMLQYYTTEDVEELTQHLSICLGEPLTAHKRFLNRASILDVAYWLCKFEKQTDDEVTIPDIQNILSSEQLLLFPNPDDIHFLGDYSPRTGNRVHYRFKKGNSLDGFIAGSRNNKYQ